MATIAQWLQYYFYFLSFELLNEPDHLHIANGKTSRGRPDKIWLDSLKWADTGSLTEKELNRLEKIVEENREIFRKMISDTKAGKKVKRIRL